MLLQDILSAIIIPISGALAYYVFGEFKEMKSELKAMGAEKLLNKNAMESSRKSLEHRLEMTENNVRRIEDNLAKFEVEIRGTIKEMLLKN